MKKIILLVLILLAIAYTLTKNSLYSPIIVSYSGNRPLSSIITEEYSENKDVIWERVNMEIFNGDKEGFERYEGPILLELYNATSKDSLAVNNLLNELRVLLPNKKIDYIKTYTGLSLEEIDKALDSINKLKKNGPIFKEVNGFNINMLKVYPIKFHFSKDSLFNKKLSHKIKKDIEKGIAVDDFETYSHRSKATIDYGNGFKTLSGYDNSSTYFSFKDSVSIDERQRIVEQVLIKLLSCDSFVIFNDDLDRKITDSDKSVLKKLYSDNLWEDYKTYMYNAYPWRYATYYMSPTKSNRVATWVSVFIGLVAFILGFSVLYKRRFKFKYFEYLIPLLVISLFTINIYKVYIYISDPFTFESGKRYLANNISFIVFAIILSFLFMIVERFIIKKQTSFFKQLILIISCTFLILILPIFFIHYFDRMQVLNKESNALLILALGLTAIRGGLIYIENISDSIIKQKDIELSRLKALHAKAELKSLQSQINPHFLYNSLNSIASLAPIDSKRTQEMAHSLSDLFKYSINRKGKKMSTIKDEINMVNTYLGIEKIRFGDRLKFVVEVDKAIENHEIPLFLIQPLIENAVKHGISKQAGNGEILLKIKEEKNELVITVSDSGPNFPKGLVSGHGLQTVYDLLRLSYGDKASLNWTNLPEKTITITMPKKQ